MSKRVVLLIQILIMALAAAALPAVAQTGGAAEPATCASTAGFQHLDFWLGEWDVYVGARKVGTNRIEKILSGCAVTEHWQASSGGAGMSLFYYLPAIDTWRQVWVTGQATRPGGVKEKTLVEFLEGGGIRFQGEIAISAGRTYLDRTTLKPLAEGRVQQVIETSRDGGTTWKQAFDATYVPKGQLAGD